MALNDYSTMTLPQPERTKEETMRRLRYTKRVFEAFTSGGTEEEITAAVLGAMKELERERMESEGIQDYSSAEKTN
jgi:hypothetical protein